MLIPIRLAPPPVAAASSSSSSSLLSCTPAKSSGGGATQEQEQQEQHGPEEWSLVELNGTLSASIGGGSTGNAAGAAAVGLGGLPLGQLSFAAPDKVGVCGHGQGKAWGVGYVCVCGGETACHHPNGPRPKTHRPTHIHTHTHTHTPLCFTSG
jgi:hypothetical protein